ncbi:MAG: efflux RND transporter periplasmic adaptor subunit [Terriglobia bacterium]
MRHRWIHAGVLMLLAGSIGALSGCSHSGSNDPNVHAIPAVTAGIVKITRQDLSNQLQIASEFIPYQEIDVHAKVSGYVKKLYINWGTHVKQGQLMAVLEVPELDAGVMRDRAAVQRSKQDVARAQEEISRAQSTYTVAHLTYTRLHGVQKTQPNLVAQEEVDVAHGKAMESSAAVSAAKDALAAAQQELAVSQSTLDRDQDLFNYSRITAPFDGVVTQLDAYTGSLLPAGTSSSQNALSLCHLSQNDLLRLVIPVPSRIVPDVHVGETVNVQVPSLNKVFQGKVSLTSGQINFQTRTMHTEVEVPNPSYDLVPGMYAYVQLPVKSAAHALTVPLQAVNFAGHDEGTILTINGNDEVEPKKVPLGLQTANAVQILSGVHAGEQVVFGDLGRFHAGEKVKPVPVNLAALSGGQF